MPNILDRVIKYSIYVLVFLLPIFFLPFSFEAFEYNKQYLLFFLVSLAVFARLAKMVVYDKEIKFRRSPLDLFILGFLAINIISAIFSVDKDSSFFGFYGRFSNGLIGLLSLAGLYFLITNNVGGDNGAIRDNKGVIRDTNGAIRDNKGVIRDTRGVLKVFLLSSFLAVVAGYFSIFGVWAKIAGFLPLPAVMLQRTFNPVAGSLEGLAVFSAVILVFLAGMLLTKESRKIHWLQLAAVLGLLAIINYAVAWSIVLAALILVIAFSLWKRIFRQEVNRLLIPIFLVIIVVGLMVLRPLNFGLPREQTLDLGTSWQVGLKSALDQPKNIFFGSGPGTFLYDFAKEKPLKFNQNPLWQIRFDMAGSHLAEILATLGFLGILSYLTILGIFLLIAVFFVGSLKQKVIASSSFQLPLLMIFSALLVGQFVYYQNTSLAFAFWLIMGLSVVSWQRPVQEKTISFKNFPELSLVFSTLIIVLGIVLAISYFFAAKFYLADIKSARSLSLVGQDRIKAAEGAVRLNPQSARYRVVLSRAYLAEALAETQKPQASQDARKIQVHVAGAIDQARSAAVLQSNNVVNWGALAMIYQEIGSFAAGAADWGIKSLERAIELEPTNPVFYTELGKLHLFLNNEEKAKESFEKAIGQKADHIDALIQLALLSERQGDVSQAIAQLEQAAQNNPLNIDVLFQLGRLYFNQKRTSEAINLLKTVVILAPDHSNALYSLGMAYAAQGETSLAIEQLERVLELNPDNQDVIKKLRDLRGK